MEESTEDILKDIRDYLKSIDESVYIMGSTLNTIDANYAFSQAKSSGNHIRGNRKN